LKYWIVVKVPCRGATPAIDRGVPRSSVRCCNAIKSLGFEGLDALQGRRRQLEAQWKPRRQRILLKALLGEVDHKPGSAVCVVCVPAPYLAQVRDLLERSAIAWGSQDVSRFEQGAYTGEVSGAMLAELGCRYAIVGHSERRTLFGETIEVSAEKYVAARKAGSRRSSAWARRWKSATRASPSRCWHGRWTRWWENTGVAGLDGGFVAYEPVWAIGTGRTATAQQAEEAHAFIRERIAEREAAVAEGCPSCTAAA
jgi:triosephosphate isomerase